MAKKTKSDEKAPESKPADTLAIDALAECDKRGVNLSVFGTNGRKQALCVLYTRTKPSRKIAQAKGASLAEAFANCLKAADDKATDAIEQADAEEKEDTKAANGDMF
jgi:hypothetical protein